ncbi:N-acetylmuramoyl-L-alanine amidase [Mycobacterium sp. AZCC_0083]|uniref:N-acetylmuramoyl-L-alanine amidase n=1 Tax=Mycobacterium sp. AZCC_0083 TaxID=2735882 RepID=UPI00161AB8E4|nr:N-acetylmuramoyl-L-alanine amidase [Mycobacterium sp. AZCC_0083]MBB5167189.1 N-acetyl-anhydromuramyl-L-alanine amidase AmpD [Mycobacterium sp. AZCC_0083]
MSFTQFLQDDPLLAREQIMAIAIDVAKTLGMPDVKGAAILNVMAVSVEVGVEDNDPPHARRFWCPANHNDGDSFNYSHDSVSNDNRSIGYLQQQKGPNGELWWGTTAQQMDPHQAFISFQTRLKKRGYDASNAQSAGEAAQAIQGSAFPDRYREQWDDINALYDAVAGTITAPTTPTQPSFSFTEKNIIDGENASNRQGHNPRLFVLHTEEGNLLGQALDNWMDNNEVSYHYAVDPDASGAVAWDLVDTDLSSWSVLSANPDSINLVFAGSYAAMSRTDWLSKYGKAIKVAAYLAVQDCRKYGIETTVRVGFAAGGYSSLKTSNGITDHYGITKGLGIGTHTDVGPNFPWDVFASYVAQFANGTTEEDDMFTDADRALLTRVHFELTNKWNSRSIYAEPGEGPVDTLAGMVLNDDGMEHSELVERLAVLGDPDSLRRVIRVAAGEGVVTDAATVARAAKILAEVPADILTAYEAAAK